jgi:excisionase family DNA binding protein
MSEEIHGDPADLTATCHDETRSALPGGSLMPPVGRSKPKAPRVALTIDEACESLGISRDHFERHVMRQLRIIQSGRRRLVPVTELERWADRQAASFP